MLVVFTATTFTFPHGHAPFSLFPLLVHHQCLYPRKEDQMDGLLALKTWVEDARLRYLPFGDVDSRNGSNDILTRQESITVAQDQLHFAQWEVALRRLTRSRPYRTILN